MRGFDVQCNNCGNSLSLYKEITKREDDEEISIYSSDQMGVPAAWVRCNRCKQELQVGLTVWDSEYYTKC